MSSLFDSLCRLRARGLRLRAPDGVSLRRGGGGGGGTLNALLMSSGVVDAGIFAVLGKLLVLPTVCCDALCICDSG